MPTEKRSSNTEMVSVPRHWAQETITAGPGECVSKSDIALLSKALADPAPQPHPDPIAWMVGTAFWWTKEEAERDAAATGMPIVGLGPMAGIAPADQRQGEPVALPARKKTTSGLLSDSNTHNRGWNACLDEIDKLGPLYTHAEVEPTPECFCVEHGLHIEDLKAQLAEAHTLLREIHDGRISGHERWLKIEAVLSASAEPSAPVERDDETLIDALRTCEKWFIKHSPTAPLIGGFGDAEHPMLTCIRAALECKP